MDKVRFILKKSLGVGSLVMLSRLIGFVRDLLLAAFFGTTSSIEAFLVAQRIPNAWRGFLGEGTVNASAVPVLSEYRDQPQRLFRIFSSFFIIIMITSGAVCILGALNSRILVRLIAPGLTQNFSQWSLASDMTQKMFLYLLLMSVYAGFMAVLFCFGRFYSSYIGPVLGNFLFVAGILTSVFLFHSSIKVIVVFFIISGLFYFLVQIPSLIRIGFRFYFPVNIRDLFLPQVIRILKLFFQRVMIFSVYYINIFLDTIFSSLYWIVGTGGIACLYYASRVVLLPVNLIGGSFSTVSVPLLSRYRHLKDERSFEEAFMYSLKNTSFFIIPCSVILCLYAYPIIKLLFQRGQFTPYSTFLTSWTLIFYGLGLYFFASNNILGTFFFSHNDLLTPFKVSLGALVLNAILDLCLIFSLKLGGVALATTISAVVRYAVFIRIIEAKGLSFKDYFSYFKKPLVFSLFSGVISLGVFYFLRVSEIPKIFSTFLIYGASYFIFSSKFRFIPFWK